MVMNRHKCLITSVLLMLISLSLFIGISKDVSSAQNGMPGMKPAPTNLQLAALDLSDDGPMEDDEITITARITGNGTEVKNLTIIILVDNMEIERFHGQELPDNGTLEVSAAWKAVAGTHSVNVSAFMEGGQAPVFLGGKGIKVEAKPVGDVWTLVLAMAGFMVLIVLATVFPGILEKLKGGNK